MILKIAQALRCLHREEKGFTLVELLIVLAIIGLLVAIAIPVYANVMERAAQKVHDANLRTLDGAINMYFMGEDRWPPDLDSIVPIYLDNIPNVPAVLLGNNPFADGTEYGYDSLYNRATPLGDWGGYRDY